MNDKEIKVHTDKRGKAHIDIYSGDPREKHQSIHINIDTSTGKGNIVDTTNGQKEITDTQCYLTTACMRSLTKKFDDNCEELTILRWFRDNYVSKEDIKHYYENAPIIVEAINQTENSNLIYNYIYKNVIVVCVEAIKNGNYVFAYNRYKNSVLALEEEFIYSKLENISRKTIGYCKHLHI